MELTLPSIQYKESFIEAVKEYRSDKEYPPIDIYQNLSIPELENDFEAFVEKELSKARGENLPEGYVPQTSYWLIDENEFIGWVRIRHSLTENLKKLSGHIGYDIRPGKRKQGYGKKILELALPKAKEIGIERVLVTCDATNTASRKIIEKNGGIFKNEVPNPETGVDKLRYWIS